MSGGPGPRSLYWAEQSTAALSARDPGRTIAVLPLGATEQHGPHLPLAVDTIQVEAVVRTLAAALPPESPVLFLPTLPVTLSTEHLGFAGTLSLTPATFLATLAEIAGQVARNGVRKLVFLNGHGGNTAILDVAARAARVEHGMLALRLNWFGVGLPEGLFPEGETAKGIHGGAMETSLMLHLAPELVDMGRARDFGNRAAAPDRMASGLGLAGPGTLAWATEDLDPEGACGDATAASAEAGERVLAHVVAGIVPLLARLDALSPEDEIGTPAWPVP